MVPPIGDGSCGGVGGVVTGLQEAASDLVHQRSVGDALGHAVDGSLPVITWTIR